VTRTANQTLLITLKRQSNVFASFALGRAAQNLGLGLGAAIAGFVISSAQDLRSFQALILVRRDHVRGVSASYLLEPNQRAGRTPAPVKEDSARSPRSEVPDRHHREPRPHHRRLCAVANILPPFAKAHTPSAPVQRNLFVSTPSRRDRAGPRDASLQADAPSANLATASGLFAIALLGVLPATADPFRVRAAALLCAVATVIAIGECVHSFPRPTRRRPRSSAPPRPLHLGLSLM